MVGMVAHLGLPLLWAVALALLRVAVKPEAVAVVLAALERTEYCQI
jgi:hypothetical protein